MKKYIVFSIYFLSFIVNASIGVRLPNAVIEAIKMYEAIDINEVKEVVTHAQTGACAFCLSSTATLLPFVPEESRLVTIATATLLGGCIGIAQGLYTFHYNKKSKPGTIYD